MSLRSILTGQPDQFSTPEIHYPEIPRIINVGNFRVEEYISPEVVNKHVKALVETINLKNFQAILVNLSGGQWLYDRLSSIKRDIPIPVELIEYHRPKDGFGAIETIPIPKYLKGEDCLVIDDIKDTAGVLKAIMDELGKNSQAIVVVDKNVKKLKVENVTAAIKVDDIWLGGCGMNMGLDKEKDEIRNWSGIVVKI